MTTRNRTALLVTVSVGSLSLSTACNEEFGHECGEGTELSAMGFCVAKAATAADTTDEADASIGTAPAAPTSVAYNAPAPYNGATPSPAPIPDAGAPVPGVTCGTGTALYGSTCVSTVPVVTCGTGTVPDDGGTCVGTLTCGTGTSQSGGICVGTLSCGSGTVEQNSACVPIIHTEVIGLDGMMAYACTAGRCRSSDVVGYWQDHVTSINGTHWDDYATRRRVEFFATDTTATAALRFNVSDDNGNTWQCAGGGACPGLTFPAGRPVSITFVNSTTGKHAFTSAPFYRTVAWRRAENAVATYQAPAFDSFIVNAGATSIVHFVPMIPGTYTSYCHIGVTNGQSFPEIIAGTLTPTLTTGHASRGMVAPITISDPTSAFATSTLFQEATPDRDPALDSDPRRNSTWWTTPSQNKGACCTNVPVTFTELSSTAFSYNANGGPITSASPVNLHVGNGYQFILQNGAAAANHDFSAVGLFETSILRAAIDTIWEIRAPYLTDVTIVPGGTSNVYVVPTSQGSHKAHCPTSVTTGRTGSPDLTTGHAGLGMQAPIIVTP
jgi:hypothetical protein